MDDKQNVIHLPVNANIHPLSRENLDDAFASVARDDEPVASIIVVVGKDGRFALRVLHKTGQIGAVDAMLRGREYMSAWIRDHIESFDV